MSTEIPPNVGLNPEEYPAPPVAEVVIIPVQPEDIIEEGG